MSKKYKIWLTVLIVAGVILTLFLGKEKDTDYIHIAIVSAETGDLAEIGKDMSRAAILKLDQVNASGGIHGKMIKYHIFDDQGDPKMAVNIANRISQNSDIIAVVGHLTSGTMSAAAPVYYKNNVPVVMPVPTNPKITSQGFDNVFRIPPNDNDQAPFLARYLWSRDKEARVVIAHDITAYGVGFAESFRAQYEAGGGEILAYDGSPAESRDFRTLITKLKSLNPTHVLLGATYDMGAPFVRQMREMGLNATVLAGDGCFGSEFIAQAGNAAEGTIVSFIAPGKKFSEKTERFFKDYEAKYGTIVSFAPLGYDAASVAVEVITRLKKLDRKEFIKTIKNDKFSYEGVTGIIKFDDAGDNINKNLTLWVVRDGEWVFLDD